jgi:dipeptidyl aminopeptidase/acylaminoacyl peptidase
MDVRRLNFVFRIALLCLALGGAERAVAAPLSIDALAQFEAVTSVNLSPDGKHVVGLVAAPGQKWPVISIWKADALEQTATWIPSQNMRPISVDFIGNDRIWFLTEQEINRGGTKTFTRKLYFTDLKGSKFEEPLKRGGATNDAVRNAESTGVTVDIFNDELRDEDVVLLERSDIGQGGVQQIYRFNVETGEMRLIGEGSEKASFMSAGVNLETGELLLQQKVENIDGDFWLRRYMRKDAKSPWEYHPELSYAIKKRRTLAPVGFDADPNKLLVVTNRNSNFTEVLAYDIAAKRFIEEPLFRNDKFDIFDVVMDRDPVTRANLGPIGVEVAGPAIETIFVDEYWAGIHRTLKRQFPGQQVSLDERQLNNQRALIRVESDAQPHTWYLLKLGDKLQLATIGGQRPWIDPKTLGQSRWVTYKARDGLEIPAILTTPPGWTPEKGRIPAVVHPHGGPWSRDFMGWDGSGWVQFMATRGYAVLRPQYRGSDNLGLQLWLAGDENWGLKMQDDKDDGARWMVEQGIADPRKIAIFGYSYGGFAAIAASVRPNGPYVCALSGAGVSSLALLSNFWGSNRILKEVQAWTVTGLDPLKEVAQADIPILLYHGDRDRQADTEHSRLFYAAMKKAGKDVEYVEIKDMWHTLPWRPEWHRQSLKLIEDWLAGPNCFGGPGKQLTASSVAPAAAN